MADKTEIREAISDILDGADLNTITAKKVRQQLEDTLKTDLTDRRKEIDALVMEIVNEKTQAKDDSDRDESEEEEKPVKKAPSKRRSKKESDSDDAEDDYKPEAKKSKAKKGSDSDDDWKKAPKRGGGAAKGAKKGGGGGGTGYTKTCRLSPELARVMGEEAMARHEVVKRMWKIIKEKNLYDPKNKQFAICNEDLLPVFGVKRFRTFGMMKYLKNHFTD